MLTQSACQFQHECPMHAEEVSHSFFCCSQPAGDCSVHPVLAISRTTGQTVENVTRSELERINFLALKQ